MKRFRVTGNYGTFEITRVVLATDEDEAFEQTGISGTLFNAGWSVGPIDGEEWTITEEVES